MARKSKSLIEVEKMMKDLFENWLIKNHRGESMTKKKKKTGKKVAKKVAKTVKKISKKKTSKKRAKKKK